MFRGPTTRDSYRQLSLLCVDGIRRKILLHRWVMEMYLGRRLDRYELVCHHCDNPPCFRLDHLFVGTPTDNMQDMLRKGRAKNGVSVGGARWVHRGVQLPFAVLTEANVRIIRQRRVAGVGSRELAETFGVAVGTVCDVISRRTWKHVD